MECKFLKLANGDNIIAMTEDSCDSFENKEFLNVIDPVQVGTVRIPRGSMVIETYVLQPWIKMAVKEGVKIPTRSIVAAVNILEDAVNQYKQYVEDTKGLTLRVEELEDDDSDISFDDFLDEVLNTNDEEDDDVRYRTSDGKTIH